MTLEITKHRNIRNSGIDRGLIGYESKISEVTTKCYDSPPEKSMKNSLKQSGLALLGNVNMTILINILVFKSFKISVNEYIPSVDPKKSRENLHWIRC